MPLAVLTPRNIDLEPGTWTDALPPRQNYSKCYLAKCNHIPRSAKSNTSVVTELLRIAIARARDRFHLMSRSPHISEIGALVGERARGEMLSALMGGRALTAKELAFAAKITPQTASEHLHKLVGARILKSTNQGRFRYFRLASHSVSQMLENMMVLAAVAKKSPISRDNPLIKAAASRLRSCYSPSQPRRHSGLPTLLCKPLHTVHQLIRQR
jgi:DNA-binding transcriptional ArsR family regulator